MTDLSSARIEAIVRDFRANVPQATVNVFVNNSSDIEGDAYILVDGDDTYDASIAPQLVAKLFEEGLDMVVGNRVTDEQAAYRLGHRFGNMLLTGCVSLLFGLETGLVPLQPAAILCSAIMLFGVVLLACGIILDAVTKARIEQNRFAYLALPAHGN